MAEKVIIISILICSIISCSTKPSQGSHKTNVNNIFSIEGQCTFDTQEDKNGVTGTLWCGNIALKYSYGKDSYSVPLTQEEEFRNAFRGNYHVKFFEKIHFDPKLNSMFIDSVQIKTIQPVGPSNSNLLFPCSSCNKVASLIFRKREYLFPFYFNGKDLSNYIIKEDTIDGHCRKIFLTNVESMSSGLFLRPVSKDKNSKTLSIITINKVELLLLEKKLESVKLIQNL